MAKNTLEEFIKSYIKNTPLSNGGAGYADWLRKNAINKEREISEGIERASENHLKNLSDNSAFANKVAKNGLSESGYAAYLLEKSLKNRDNAVKLGIASLATQRLKNNRDYTDSLTLQESAEEEAKRREEEELLRKKQEAEAEMAQKAEKEAKKLYSSVKSRLENANMANYDKAYAYAIEMGLDKENAEKVAKSTTKIAREKAYISVVKAIVNRNFTESQAEEYARGLGLSEEDVKSLCEIAFNTNVSVDSIVSHEDYLAYLEEKIKNKIN